MMMLSKMRFQHIWPPIVWLPVMFSAVVFLAVVFLAGGGVVAKTNSDIVKRYVPNAQLSGEGRFSYWFWDIYDARLYAPEGRWRRDLPYALSLSYLRDFNGEDIAERSIEEIREQGFKDETKLARWYERMRAIFPDVDERTTLTGIRDRKGDAIFYRNGRRIGIVKDSEFSERFFNIWLGKRSSEPSLREKLLGKVN